MAEKITESRYGPEESHYGGWEKQVAGLGDSYMLLKYRDDLEERHSKNFHPRSELIKSDSFYTTQFYLIKILNELFPENFPKACFANRMGLVVERIKMPDKYKNWNTSYEYDDAIGEGNLESLELSEQDRQEVATSIERKQLMDNLEELGFFEEASYFDPDNMMDPNNLIIKDGIPIIIDLPFPFHTFTSVNPLLSRSKLENYLEKHRDTIDVSREQRVLRFFNRYMENARHVIEDSYENLQKLAVIQGVVS